MSKFSSTATTAGTVSPGASSVVAVQLDPRQLREKELLRQLEESNRIAQEAAGHGRNALTSLEEQKETLDKTEDTLEASEYVVQQSMRALRYDKNSSKYYCGDCCSLAEE
jgi:replication-associated recombination protein RarA